MAPPVKPSVPVFVSARNTSITVEVTSVIGATSYRWRVYRNSALTMLDSSISNARRRITVTGLRPDTSYWFVASAVNSDGNSAFSDALEARTKDGTLTPSGRTKKIIQLGDVETTEWTIGGGTPPYTAIPLDFFEYEPDQDKGSTRPDKVIVSENQLPPWITLNIVGTILTETIDLDPHPFPNGSISRGIQRTAPIDLPFRDFRYRLQINDSTGSEIARSGTRRIEVQRAHTDLSVTAFPFLLSRAEGQKSFSQRPNILGGIPPYKFSISGMLSTLVDENGNKKASIDSSRGYVTFEGKAEQAEGTIIPYRVRVEDSSATPQVLNLDISATVAKKGQIIGIWAIIRNFLGLEGIPESRIASVTANRSQLGVAFDNIPMSGRDISVRDSDGNWQKFKIFQSAFEPGIERKSRSVPPNPTLLQISSNSINVEIEGLRQRADLYEFAYSTNSSIDTSDPIFRSFRNHGSITGLRPNTDYWIAARITRAGVKTGWSGTLKVTTLA